MGDLIQYPQPRLLFAIGDVHGLADELGLQAWDLNVAVDIEGLKQAGGECVFFADVASFHSRDLQYWMEQHSGILSSERHSGILSSLVLIAKDFDAFGTVNFACHMRVLVENFSMVFFATLDQKDSIKSVFCNRATSPGGLEIGMAMVPYPRIHFLTLLGADGKSCGREVGDGDLLVTSVKFGSNAPTLPNEKLSWPIIKNVAGEPIHWVTVPGDNVASVIAPCSIICAILDVIRGAGFNDDADVEEKEKSELVEDLHALRMDYDEMSLPTVWGEEEE